MVMKQSAIYKIQSKIKPEKFYIGSAVDIKDRWRIHLKDLNNNEHNPKLQYHFNKYGEEDLVFIIIEPCFPQFLIIREQFYLDTLKPFFNVCKIAGSPLGIKRSKETIQKMCKAQQKRTNYPSPSIETRNKMSIAHKLNPSTTQFKKGVPVKNRPNFPSEETKNKIKQKLLGKCYNTFPEEHRKKLQEGAKKMWERRKLKIA